MKNTFSMRLHSVASHILFSALMSRAKKYRKIKAPKCVFSHDYIGNSVAAYGRFEAAELESLADMLSGINKNAAVIDVGANIGNHSLFFAEKGFRNIHCFEPNPLVFSLLKINTSDEKGIRVYNEGISEKEGDFEAVVPLDNHGKGSIHVNDKKNNESVVNFKLRHYEAFAVSKDRTSLVKIDVEGHEESVMRAMANTLCRDWPSVLFECNLRSDKARAESALGFMKKIGYNKFETAQVSKSLVPIKFPSFVRLPLRVLETLLRPSRSQMCLVEIVSFEEKDYSLIVANKI